MAFQEFELRTKGMLKKKKSIIMECFRISWRELNALFKIAQNIFKANFSQIMF